jgi:predicted CXXCH cytochrome family protein
MRAKHMFRILTIFFSLLLVISLLSSAAYAGNADQEDCLTCHEEKYVKATSYSNIHPVVLNSCTKCHYFEAVKSKSNRIASMAFQKDTIFLLGDLTKKDKKHIIKIDALDTDRNPAEPMMINTSNEKISNYPEELYELTEISNIRTESVQKKIFAKAVISWNTSVPTAFEVEYGTSTKHRKVLTSKKNYAREHNAVLTGLRHKSKYTFTITSRDMNGKTIRSEEHSFDTSRAFDLTNIKAEPEDDSYLEPGITYAELMNIANKKDVFIRISSNKLVRFNLSVTESKGKETRPCKNFVQTRTSTIKVCEECHAQNASHPVGVRSKNPDVKIPDELPVIENGVITCVTCHFPHGGETEYFLRIKFSKEICVKCHPKQYQ